MAVIGEHSGALLAAAGAGAGTGTVAQKKDAVDVKQLLLNIKKADQALSADDWRESYACFMWQEFGSSTPPAWASVFGDNTICPGWNSTCGCSGGSLCEFRRVCTVCRSSSHGVLSKNSADEYMCPSTQALAGAGYDVVDYSAVVKIARTYKHD